MPLVCRSIRTLHSFAPPATEDEVVAAALQYVRKVSGSARPAPRQRRRWRRRSSRSPPPPAPLLDRLVVHGPAKDREVEAAKARARAATRYAPAP